MFRTWGFKVLGRFIQGLGSRQNTHVLLGDVHVSHGVERAFSNCTA